MSAGDAPRLAPGSSCGRRARPRVPEGLDTARRCSVNGGPVFMPEVQHCGGCLWGWGVLSGMFPTVFPCCEVVVVIPTQREAQGLTGCVVRLLDSSTAQE